MEKKEILLICYSFPPHPGIGGRRWAKFAKYLAKDGYTIYVLSAKSFGRESSEWASDVKSPNIKIFQSDTKVPRVFDKPVVSFWNKVTFRWWKYYSKLASKGRIFDKSFFWKRDLLDKAEELIRINAIKNVVCTVPPYRLAYYTAILKDKNPHIRYILDYRDPWTDNRTFHEFSDLNKRRKEYEQKMEYYSIAKADVIISSTEQMTIWAKQKAIQPEKCITISNGYDFEDVLKDAAAVHNEKYTILFAGNLYDAVDYVYLPFVEYIKRKEQAAPDFKKKFCFKFYGNIPFKYIKAATDAGISSFEFYGFVPLSQLKEKYLEADAFMMFTAFDHAFAFNTKFYEYVSYRKPILHFSNDGEVSNFIESNQIGVGVSPNSLSQKLSDIFYRMEQRNFIFNPAFDSSAFDIANITAKLKEVFV